MAMDTSTLPPPPVPDPWPAPTASGPIQAVVGLPGSKSQTNRALILAALGERPSTLLLPLISRDTLLMVQALRALGATLDEQDQGWVVTPGELHGPARVDAGLAGTVMRFVPPVAVLARGDVEVDGDPRARDRPMRGLVEALQSLGADLEATSGTAGLGLPLRLHGRGSLAGGPVTVDASASSQIVSGLLLAGARYDAGVRVRHQGAPIPSAPHLAMTVALLRQAGAQVDDTETDVWDVRPGPLHLGEVVIEPDLSNAAPFLGAAMVTAGHVRISGWPRVTTQPGDRLRDLLVAMGARVERHADGLSVHGPGTIHGVDVDLHEVGELTPVLAALAAVADRPSRLRGIGHLRGHETDRLTALATELSRLGAKVRVEPDGLTIVPRPLRPVLVRTYADHRLATAAAVLGLVVPGLQVQDVATTAKTMPGFVELWAQMLSGPPAGAPR